APAGDVCVGGGGRFLLLHLPRERKLAVFDANEAKVVKYLPVPEDKPLLAAGRDQLVVGLPESNVLQRWSLATFEREAAVPAPQPGALKALAMGSATAGPLLVVGADGLALLDPQTFRPSGHEVGERLRPQFDAVRMSADGRLIVFMRHYSASFLVRQGNT